MNSVAERLGEAMVLRRIDQSALAEMVGATQGAISKILVGKTRNSRLMPRIATCLQVSLPWLLGQDVERDIAVQGAAEITFDERRWLDVMRNLSMADRETVIRITHALSAISTQGNEI